MKKLLTSILFLFAFCNLFAELVVISSENTKYVVEKDNILSIQPFDSEDLFYSKKQKKIIKIPDYRSSEINAGLANGNLTRVKEQTKITFKNEINAQLSVGGAAIIGGGNATNKNDGNFIIVDIPIDEVIEKLNIKK